MPLLGGCHDGNVSDKRLNTEVLTRISRYMARHDLAEGDWLCVADSALVTEENLRQVGDSPAGRPPLDRPRPVASIRDEEAAAPALQNRQFAAVFRGMRIVVETASRAGAGTRQPGVGGQQRQCRLGRRLRIEMTPLRGGPDGGHAGKPRQALRARAKRVGTFVGLSLLETVRFRQRPDSPSLAV